MRSLLIMLTFLLVNMAYAAPYVTRFTMETISYASNTSRVNAEIGDLPLTFASPVDWGRVGDPAYYGPVFCMTGLNGCQAYGIHSVIGTYGDTWEQLGQKWIAKFGASTISMQVSQLASKNFFFCMAVTNQSHFNWGSNSAWQDIQPSSCVIASLSPAQCSIDATANINYGPINIDQINGLTKTASVSISCDRAVLVSLESLTPTVDLGHGVKSKITIDGQSTPPAMSINNTKVVNVESTLSSTNPTAGFISGNAIIIMSLE
ncbi:hypothetical protein [Serratia aquatilis]|uniref:Uncharacterized protein n=1 Tax=Serratia aquatilis TaxID=1737515 RepID=A0ABV6EEQ5_9GAMM